MKNVISATVGSWMNFEGGVSLTLMARDYKEPQIICYESKETDVETDLSRENRCAVCEDGQGPIGTGCGERDGLRFQNYTGDGIASTLDASYFKGTGSRNGKEREFIAVCVGNGQLHQTNLGGVSGSLNCMHDQQAVVYPGVGITSPQNGNNPQPGDPAPSLTNDSRNYLVANGKPQRKYIVRRLTPTECAVLQGMPRDWCEGLGGSDSAIYKAYGNGLALPCAYDVMNRIARYMEWEKTEGE